MATLIAADKVRIDRDGVPVVDGLSLATTGEHVLVLGAPRALFECASGMRAVEGGSLRVAGHEPRAGARSGMIAGAPLDPPLPAAWTPEEYVTWSAKLAGRKGAEATRLARDAMARLKLEAVAKQRLDKVIAHAKRATVIAAALATGAQTILLEDPTLGLRDEVARNFGKLVTHALDSRAWIVFAARAELATSISVNADEALVISGGRVAAQGAPAEISVREKSFDLVISGDGETLARALEAKGARVVGTGDALVVDLGESLETRDLFVLAGESNATVIELRPLARGIS